MLHGCIPVLIQDRVEEKFSNVVDYAAFALRIAEADIEQVRCCSELGHHPFKRDRCLWIILGHPPVICRVQVGGQLL